MLLINHANILDPVSNRIKIKLAITAFFRLGGFANKVNMMKLLLPCLSLLTLLGTSASAHAQTEGERRGNPNDGTGYIGIMTLTNSEYLGSADEDTRILPYLSLNNVKGFDLFGPNLNYRLIETGTGEGLRTWSLRAGPSVTFQGNRDSEDSVNLNGFEDVGVSLPVGGYIRSTIGPVGLGLNVGKDVIGGHGGLVADASIGTFYRKGNFAIQPSLSVNWGDNKHNDSFFTVTPAQALTSGLSSFEADSGIYSYGAGIVSWIEFDNRYAISLIANHRWFTGDANNSPIINASDGSDTGYFLSLGLSRKFDTKQW